MSWVTYPQLSNQSTVPGGYIIRTLAPVSLLGLAPHVILVVHFADFQTSSLSNALPLVDSHMHPSMVRHELLLGG